MSFHRQPKAASGVRFGRSYDLGELEKRLSVHRDGEHLFTAKDVARVAALVQDFCMISEKGSLDFAQAPTWATRCDAVNGSARACCRRSVFCWIYSPCTARRG
jgi:hypothetical protein